MPLTREDQLGLLLSAMRIIVRMYASLTFRSNPSGDRSALNRRRRLKPLPRLTATIRDAGLVDLAASTSFTRLLILQPPRVRVDSDLAAEWSFMWFSRSSSSQALACRSSTSSSSGSTPSVSFLYALGLMSSMNLHAWLATNPFIWCTMLLFFLLSSSSEYSSSLQSWICCRRGNWIGSLCRLHLPMLISSPDKANQTCRFLKLMRREEKIGVVARTLQTMWTDTFAKN